MFQSEADQEAGPQVRILEIPKLLRCNTIQAFISYLLGQELDNNIFDNSYDYFRFCELNIDLAMPYRSDQEESVTAQNRKSLKSHAFSLFVSSDAEEDRLLMIRLSRSIYSGWLQGYMIDKAIFAEPTPASESQQYKEGRNSRILAYCIAADYLKDDHPGKVEIVVEKKEKLNIFINNLERFAAEARSARMQEVYELDGGNSISHSEAYLHGQYERALKSGVEQVGGRSPEGSEMARLQNLAEKWRKRAGTKAPGNVKKKIKFNPELHVQTFEEQGSYVSEGGSSNIEDLGLKKAEHVNGLSNAQANDTGESDYITRIRMLLESKHTNEALVIYANIALQPANPVDDKKEAARMLQYLQNAGLSEVYQRAYALSGYLSNKGYIKNDASSQYGFVLTLAGGKESDLIPFLISIEETIADLEQREGPALNTVDEIAKIILNPELSAAQAISHIFEDEALYGAYFKRIVDAIDDADFDGLTFSDMAELLANLVESSRISVEVKCALLEKLVDSLPRKRREAILHKYDFSAPVEKPPVFVRKKQAKSPDFPLEIEKRFETILRHKLLPEIFPITLYADVGGRIVSDTCREKKDVKNLKDKEPGLRAMFLGYLECELVVALLKKCRSIRELDITDPILCSELQNNLLESEVTFTEAIKQYMVDRDADFDTMGEAFERIRELYETAEPMQFAAQPQTHTHCPLIVSVDGPLYFASAAEAEPLEYEKSSDLQILAVGMARADTLPEVYNVVFGTLGKSFQNIYRSKYSEDVIGIREITPENKNKINIENLIYELQLILRKAGYTWEQDDDICKLAWDKIRELKEAFDLKKTKSTLVTEPDPALTLGALRT